MCNCFKITRDILFFILLIFLIKTAIKRSFIHIKQEKKSAWKKFPVHELDKGFLFALKEAKKQVTKTIDIAKNKNNKTIIKELNEFNAKIDIIEKKYKKNSPATFFLGPIGTTSIILKEQKLEKELLEIINRIKEILYTLKNVDPEHIKLSNNNTIKLTKRINIIESGIINNNKLIESIC